jgi:hypothetical protein
MNMMWIDLSFQVQYEPTYQAKRKLDDIAAGALAGAKAAFAARNLDEAERLSGIAVSADDSKPTPLVIKGAIRRLRGSEEGVHLMAKLAARTIDTESFYTLVETYAGLPKAISPIRGITLRKAA